MKSFKRFLLERAILKSTTHMKLLGAFRDKIKMDKKSTMSLQKKTQLHKERTARRKAIIKKVKSNVRS